MLQYTPYIHYTGIGSRKTPANICNIMSAGAWALATKNYWLRSGAAPGADTAFESGSYPDQKEIYLSWKNFNNNSSDLYTITAKAFELAAQIYGNRWTQLSHGVQCLMARNVYQVLGYDLETPSKFVVCWTKDGCTSHETRNINTGGTGQAIALASISNIPVYNLKNNKDLNTFKSICYDD